MNIGKEGSVTIEAAIILPLVTVFLISIVLGIYALGVRVALTRLVSDVVSCISCEATMYNLRLNDSSDQAVVNMAMDRCWKEGILNKENIEIRNMKIPANGQGDSVMVSVVYNLGLGGVLGKLIANPKVEFVQKPWIDLRVNIKDIQKLLLSHVYDWANSLGSIENKPQGESVVYVTNTGNKYHKAWCNCLRYSSVELKFMDALSRGYTPCEFCVLMTAEIIGYPLQK